jgi:hypothetical protein
MSYAIVEAAAGSGGSQMTISARTVVIVVKFATWHSIKCDSVVGKNNWLVVYQLENV